EVNANLAKGFFEMMLTNIHDPQIGTVEYDFKSVSDDIAIMTNELNGIKSTILDKLDEIKVIPILTGDCKYLRRAREPIWKRPRKE
ncbi:hypothetical protein ACFLU3_02120, partial [Chloroflexota bacterium]